MKKHELIEFLKLKEKLFQGNLFVINDNSQDWQRYNELAGKFLNIYRKGISNE